MSISVVIPAYNASRFIAQTLESTLAQTLPPDEVIVVDDGSTDATAAIAERYAPRVRVLRTTNHGQATARNFGVKTAGGEWIAFVDADDVWEPNKLERQMAELARTGADLCYCGHVLLLQKGDTATLGAEDVMPAAEDIREALYRDITFLPSGVVLRRSAFEAVGGFDVKERGTEDYDLWLRLLHAGVPMAGCPEPLFRYRRHERNTLNDKACVEALFSVYRRHVLPHLPRRRRWIAFNRFRSPRECDLAFFLREQGDGEAAAMMARSIAHSPFGYFLRYKVLAHMLYQRARGGARRRD